MKLICKREIGGTELFQMLKNHMISCSPKLASYTGKIKMEAEVKIIGKGTRSFTDFTIIVEIFSMDE